MNPTTKSLKDYFHLNSLQLAKAREAKALMIFPDPITGAIYLKTLAQAQNAFTLLEMVIGECPEELQKKIFGILAESGAIKIKGEHKSGNLDL